MKKMSVVLILLTAALLTMGFSCVNDPFTVSVNLPISAVFAVNSAGYARDTVIVLNDNFDQSYAGKIKSSRVYDLRVSTIGDFNGNFSGTFSIDNTTILVVANQKWNDFHTPQSVLGTSPLVQQNLPGVIVLNGKLSQLQSGQTVIVHVGAGGSIGAGFPSGLQVKVELLTQIDAEVSGS